MTSVGAQSALRPAGSQIIIIARKHTHVAIHTLPTNSAYKSGHSGTSMQNTHTNTHTHTHTHEQKLQAAGFKFQDRDIKSGLRTTLAAAPAAPAKISE